MHHWLKELLYPEPPGQCSQDSYGRAGSTQPVLLQSQLWDLRGAVEDDAGIFLPLMNPGRCFGIRDCCIFIFLIFLGRCTQLC